MILDTLDNLSSYAALNPLFPEVIDYLLSTDLNALQEGKIVLKENDIIVNVQLANGKTPEDAYLETHRVMVDFLIPLSATETMGYTPGYKIADAPYDEAKDMAKAVRPADTYINVAPGMFAIFFPQDGHAPCITTEKQIKKIIVKVKA